MLFKKGYKCSLATYGHLAEPVATNTEQQQRQATKAVVTNFYNTEYNQPNDAVFPTTEETEGSVTDLVGTKRPMDKWEHKQYDRLFSFYAGKVYSSFDITDDISFHGRRELLRLSLLHCRMMDISIFASWMEMSVGVQWLKSSMDLTKVSTTITQTYFPQEYHSNDIDYIHESQIF